MIEWARHLNQSYNTTSILAPAYVCYWRIAVLCEGRHFISSALISTYLVYAVLDTLLDSTYPMTLANSEVFLSLLLKIPQIFYTVLMVAAVILR